MNKKDLFINFCASFLATFLALCLFAFLRIPMRMHSDHFPPPMPPQVQQPYPSGQNQFPEGMPQPQPPMPAPCPAGTMEQPPKGMTGPQHMPNKAPVLPAPSAPELRK